MTNGSQGTDDSQCGSSQSQIADTVFTEVRRMVPEGFDTELTLESSLLELGLDSMTRMDIANRLEEVFSIRFSEESLYDMETCGDLIECIEDTMAGGDGSQRRSAADTESEPTEQREILPEYSDVEMFPECVAFHQRLAMASMAGIVNPFFRVNERVDKSVSTIEGREVVSYTSFDYLGMANDPKVTSAAKEAIDRFGTSASASRLVGGNNTIIEELDQEIARFIGAEAALVVPSGYGTNASILGHLFGEEDLILYDELAHTSITQGSLLSKARRRSFPHNDFEFVDKLLHDIRGKHRRVVIAIEGVYSMDGDYPDLPRFIDVKQRHQALLYVDEAHSIGTMGPRGRGICDHFGVSADEGDIWMGTISKTLASSGGFLAGRKTLIEYLKYTIPALVFSTATSPPDAAASLAAVRLAMKEPQRVTRLRDRAQLFLALAKEAGLNTGNSHDTPVIPIILGDSMRCVKISDELLQQGIDAQPILYPAVPESAARIRFFITADHTEEQIRRTVKVVAQCVAASEGG